MGVFAVALMRLLPALLSLGATRMGFMSNLPGVEQTYRAITSPLPQRSDGNLALESFERAIVFENVSFAHKRRETLLQDMDLTFEKGQVTAIAGPSGAGKTTIINLILGLFQPTKGKITVDGIPLQDIKQETWLSKIGFVSQDPFTYHTTIAENILFGRNEHSRESVIQAAKIANAHGFISELPQGYDTVVGDRGMTLSGGQQQRLAIARAMLGSPEILIFDEATSSLDSLSETLVQEAIDSVSIDRTVIIIAHRFSTIEHADKIIVLDNGRVVEQGPHQELLSGQGLYAHMAGEV
jgi:ABC-type multidrug transport system fused ATPase/permease subunit